MVPQIKFSDTRRKEEKKIHKQRKWEWEKEQLEELQDLYCTREARKLYSKVKETKKEFKPRVNICKAKDGSIICNQNEVLAWWNEYFDHLLNKYNNQEHTAADGENIQLIEGPILVEKMDPPTLEELEKAIKKLKNNKALGADGITAEIIKQGGTELKKLNVSINTSYLGRWRATIWVEFRNNMPNLEER